MRRNMVETGSQLVYNNSKREIKVVKEDPLEALLEEVKSNKNIDTLECVY